MIPQNGKIEKGHGAAVSLFLYSTDRQSAWDAIKIDVYTNHHNGKRNKHRPAYLHGLRFCIPDAIYQIDDPAGVERKNNAAVPD